MAMLITPAGKQTQLFPEKGKEFTIFEISKIIDGLVDPSFIDNKWVFINKLGVRIGLDFNETASALFNYNISGNCLITENDELPCQFFVPAKDHIKEKEKVNVVPTTIKTDETIIENDDDTDKKNKELLENAYNMLFNTGKTFNDIQDGFIIFKKGKHIIDYTHDPEKQMHVLNKMLDLFLIDEEYEKCQSITELKHHLFYK